MRRKVLLAGAAAALAAVVACATSEEQTGSPDLEPDAGVDGVDVVDGGSSVVEASSPDGSDAAKEADVSAPASPACNDFGWCETELPDPNLTFIDVWPFADRAFAVAQSDTLGTKVLEWTEAAQAWSYIDDNTQNAYVSGQYAGKMYAPGENEVYFTTAPGIVYHGTRATVSAPFQWDSTRLPYDGPVFADRDPGRAWSVPAGALLRYAPALGVIGTSADDVYAWYGNRVFHRVSEDGGPPTWTSEFVSQGTSATTNESFYIFNASRGDSNGSDEIWFVGGHGPTDATKGYTGCPTLFRRTPSGTSAVLDFTYTNGKCTTKPGTIQPRIKRVLPGFGMIDVPIQPTGWATTVAPVAPGAAIVIIDNAQTWYYVDTASNVARYNYLDGVSPPAAKFSPLMHSVVRVDDRLWFSGHGIVVGSEIKPDAWTNGLGIGTPESFAQAGTGTGALVDTTSVAMQGRYLNEPLYQVRASSTKNLWAVGNRHALHKKTP